MSTRCVMCAAVVVLGAMTAGAQAPGIPLDDPTFGPLVEIERIDITGNSRTAASVIRRELLVREGDRLHSGDPRFRASRFRVLALGFFVDVQLRLDRGTRRGAVVLVVDVVERGTLILNRVFLGTSAATPVWAGLDFGEGNLAGTGLGISLAGVWAQEARIAGADDQVAMRLRLSAARVGAERLGLRAGALYAQASEPVRVSGAPDDGAPENFNAFGYRRAGGTAGAWWDLTSTWTFALDGRFEAVRAPSPPADAGLEPGSSRVATATLSIEHDTRPDPVLPTRGDRFVLSAEAGGSWLGSSYDALTLVASYQQWFPLAGERHVLSGQVAAGLIVGDPPRFDRFYAGDLSPLLAPRPLGLVVSTRPPLDVFGTGADEHVYQDAYAAAGVEYAYRVIAARRRGLVYGGMLFAQVGLLHFGAVDLTFNAGLRLDTLIGVFELSLGNLVGRLPL